MGFVPGPKGKGIPNTYGVVFNTFENPEFGDISANDVHLTSVTSDGFSRIKGEDVSSLIGSLQSGAIFTTNVYIVDNVLSVRLNGKGIPSLQNVPLSNVPSQVLLGFSGSTGGLTAVQDIFNVAATATNS